MLMIIASEVQIWKHNVIFQTPLWPWNWVRVTSQKLPRNTTFSGDCLTTVWTWNTANLTNSGLHGSVLQPPKVWWHWSPLQCPRNFHKRQGWRCHTHIHTHARAHTRMHERAHATHTHACERETERNGSYAWRLKKKEGRIQSEAGDGNHVLCTAYPPRPIWSELQRQSRGVGNVKQKGESWNTGGHNSVILNLIHGAEISAEDLRHAKSRKDGWLPWR